MGIPDDFLRFDGEQPTLADLPSHADNRSDAEKVDEQVALLTELAAAIKSQRFTVQCMPHGCEIIECRSGDLLRTIRLTSIAESEEGS